MNDLLSPSNSRSRSRDEQSSNGGGGDDVQMMASSMNNFFKDIEVVKEELEVIEKLHKTLQDAHEETKSLHNSKSIKTLRTKMDSYVSQALTKAKSIKYHLESLEQSNALNRTVPGCGPGSSSDRTRTSLINGLKKKLKDSMEKFNSLREKISLDYKETIERRYFMVTGEKADEQTVENLISSGDSEDFMKRVISEQGRGNVLDTISEIQERHEAVKEIEKSLMELHQVFLDMSVLVQVQGEQLDDIESQVGRASSFVRDGNQSLQKARFYQKNTRKWTLFAIILLLIIILVILLPIILKK